MSQNATTETPFDRMNRAYVADMRREAQRLRDEAAVQEGSTREWTLSRAAFFEACADDEEKNDAKP